MLAHDLNAQDILSNSSDGFITITVDGKIGSFNGAASAIFGYDAAEVVGHNVSLLMPEPHRSQHHHYLQHYQDTGEARVVGIPREVEGRRKDGRVFPMSLSVSKIVRDGQTTFLGAVRDITQQREVEEEIHRLAFYDPLTRLPNRRMLMDRLRQAIKTSERTCQHGAVMFLDLDHFKQLNDTFSHDMGDMLLQLVALRLKACIRSGDTVARLGGDEFVVLLEPLSARPYEAAKQAEAIAIKILNALGQPYSLRGHPHTSSASIGVAMFVKASESIDELLKKADAAMYQAKSTGRGRVRFFDPVMQAAVLAHNALEHDLRLGLEREEFELHYQLQFDREGKPIGAEALLRWNSAVRGMVSPADFIPLAEETGLILPLGQRVLEAACTQLATWSQQPETALWTVAVNVSASQFSQADFVASVITALKQTGAKPNLVKLELTESTLAHDVEDIIVKMNAIKSLGVSFSLDDFGTGYSSLSYLKRLPLDQLKIDQSFVCDLLVNTNDEVIARTVVALGHSLGLTVIAEGVETQAQRDALEAMGCDAYQGYFFAPPVPAALLKDYLNK